MRRLLQLAYVEDFKLLEEGQTRGEETAHALSRKWRRVPELLIMADANAIRDQATYAPPQLRFFLCVAARVCEKVVGRGDMSEYDAWLETSMCPVLDLMK